MTAGSVTGQRSVETPKDTEAKVYISLAWLHSSRCKRLVGEEEVSPIRFKLKDILLRVCGINITAFDEASEDSISMVNF